jgi:hypothetical protein
LHLAIHAEGESVCRQPELTLHEHGRLADGLASGMARLADYDGTYFWSDNRHQTTSYCSLRAFWLHSAKSAPQNETGAHHEHGHRH